MKYFVVLTSLFISHLALGCTTIIVGKDASQNHAIIVARNDDHIAVNAQHVVIHPVQHNPSGSLFHSNANQFTYPLPKISLRYSGVPSWSTKDRSHEEAGINQFGIGVSATETIYNNKKALKADPYNTRSGINEDSIVSVLLPRIRSVKAGITLLGHIISTRGTAEGFGVAIADKNSVWYLETASGHRWVAVRIPDDSYFVSANQGRIQTFKLNRPTQYMGSKDIISFAIKHHLYDQKKDGAFNFRKAYSRIIPFDINYDYQRLYTLQHLFNPSYKNNFKSGNFPDFMKPEKLISLSQVKQALSNYYQNTPYDPYTKANSKAMYRPIALFRTQHSHILVFRPNLPIAVGATMYVAMGMPTLSFYVPFYEGLSHAPKMYDLGTAKSDDQSAFWTFRKLQVLAMTNFKRYEPIVHAEKIKYAAYLLTKQEALDKYYLEHYKKRPKEANAFLQKSNRIMIMHSLKLAQTLTNHLFTLQTAAISKKYNYPGA